MVCQAAEEELDDGEDDHGGGGLDQALEVFGEAAVAGQPGEAALDHPAPRQDLEATAVRRALDDLQPQPFAGCGRGGDGALVAAVGEQVAKPGKAAPDAGADQGQAVAVLDVAGWIASASGRPWVSVTRCACGR